MVNNIRVLKYNFKKTENQVSEHEMIYQIKGNRDPYYSHNYNSVVATLNFDYDFNNSKIK